MSQNNVIPWDQGFENGFPEGARCMQVCADHQAYQVRSENIAKNIEFVNLHVVINLLPLFSNLSS